MDRRSGLVGEGRGLCAVTGHWSTRRFSRCPTLNPRLRCSAPARPPSSPTPTCDGRLPLIVVWWPRPDALPLGNRYHPLLCHRQRPSIRPYCSRSCWPGTRGGRLESCCTWGIARSNIRATGDGENGGRTGTTAGRFFTTAQHRIPSSTDKEKKMPHPDILDLFAGLGHCLASPLASHRLERPSQCRPVVGLLARMPSLSRPIIMQDTHPRAVLQSRGGSVPLDHGSAGSASPLPREFVLLFRIIHLAGCSASRVFTWTLPCCLPRQKLFCLLSSRSRSSKSDRQTRRGPAHTLHQHRQAGRSRPGELPRQRASACSAKISAPLVIYETTLGGLPLPHPKPRALYPGRYRACRLYVCSFLSPFKLSHARCRPRRSFIGPSPLSLAWSPLTTVISGSKEP